MFDGHVGKRLAPSARREESSVEALAKAKVERAARQGERQRQRAAGTVQRWWRAVRVRWELRQDLLKNWIQQNASLVGSPGASALGAETLSSRVLPPVLRGYLPWRSPPHRQLEGGAPLPAQLLADTAALRGCLALLLRSLGEAATERNLLGLATGSAEQRQLLLAQLRRLLLLCCAAVGTSADLLTQAAASRVAALLVDRSQWKCFGSSTSGSSGGPQWLQQHLHTWLAQLPLLSAAAARLAAQLEALESQQAAAAAAEGTDSSGSSSKLAAMLNSMVVAQLRLWQQLSSLEAGVAPAPRLEAAASDQPAEAAAAAPADPAPASAAAQQHVLQLLSLPGLLARLSPATSTQLSGQASALRALLQAAAEHPPAGPAPAAWLLASLTGLVFGKKVSGGGGVGGEESAPAARAAVVEFLPPSQLLQQPGLAEAYATAAAALLPQAARGPGGGAGVPRPEALQQLWPLYEGSTLAQLLALLPLPALVRLYCALLATLDAQAGGPGRQAAARALTALAFGGGGALLPRLWRHLATGVGLPLEAPMQATRGWQVPTLRQGLANVPPEAAPAFGLFCRVYCHCLMVVDDSEYYDQSVPFSLGQQRAIAASLNTLVFRTQLPERGPDGEPLRQRPQQQQRYRMLQQHVPLLHRALYERDARRQYCPPALWLEPYQALAASGAGGAITAAAVVRALLQAAEEQGDEGWEGRAGAPALPLGPGGGLAAAASAPAALAAILSTAPQCVPFEERVAVFRALIEADKERRRYNLAPIEGGHRPLHIAVRRTHLLEDATAQLRRGGAALRGPLSVTFVDAHGMEEAGIDMGGLTKELLEAVVAAGFDRNRGLISFTPDGCAYPNPLAERLEGGLGGLEGMGLALGKALYSGVLLDLPLAPFFVSRLQGRRPVFDELSALDPEVYRSLLALKRYDGDVAALCLDFTAESDVLGTTVSEELLPGGSRLAVTSANLLLYIHLLADWHLNRRLGTAAAAFGRGLSQVVPPAWLRLFSPREVNQLLGGGEGGGIDVEDMEAHATYSGGYSASSSTVKTFWKVVRGMSQEERRALLQFVTSCSRAPLGGFQHLQPPLTIHKVDCGGGASLLAAVGGRDVDRLPTASTCHNMLKLPTYRRSNTMREKLQYAIHSGAGFELS